MSAVDSFRLLRATFDERNLSLHKSRRSGAVYFWNQPDNAMAQTSVLVVEDESIVSKDIQHSLKKLGYNVVGAAATGEQAVKLAIETQPDMAMECPTAAGIQTARWDGTTQVPSSVWTVITPSEA